MSGLTQYEVALATDTFEKFSSAATMKQVMSLFRELCSIVKLKPSNIQEFYPSLKVLPNISYYFMPSIISPVSTLL